MSPDGINSKFKGCTHSFTQIQIFFFVRAAFYSKFISTYQEQWDMWSNSLANPNFRNDIPSN
jgi:hypothetical protein